MPAPGDSGTIPSDRANRPVVLLIGSREMPVQCAKMLVDAGFDIAGLYSPDDPLRAWAEEQRHPHYFSDFAAFRERAETIVSDYLFSVLNFRLLPSSLIAAPQRFSINYHDAPLPKYAGSHATAWALKNGERTHGITWHVMTEKVDAGDILKQVTFPLTDDMTKAILDQRCYLAAMRAFRELLRELKTGTYTRTPQDLSLRTFYARSADPTSDLP